MTLALFVYWIIPILIIAAVSRFTVDTDVGTIPLKPSQSTSRPIAIPRHRPETTPSPPPSAPSQQPHASSRWPTAYRQVVTTIKRRRRHIEPDPKLSSSEPQTDSIPKPQDGSSPDPLSQRRKQQDAARNKLHNQIASLRQKYEQSPDDDDSLLLAALSYADAMRYYDVQYHDGGTYERESIELYRQVVELALARRQRAMDQGKPTDMSTSGTRNVSEEVTLDYAARSPDGILCGVYTAQGKTYFMANMFERAVESYTNCLDIEPAYLDAVNARGSALIILGRLEEAGRDLLHVIKEDSKRLFSDAFQGFARVLQAKEDAVPGGWETFVTIAENLVPTLERQLSAHPNAKQLFTTTLNRVHHALFLYHDVKTKDYSRAFHHLTESYKHKMSLLPPWIPGSELAKTIQTKKIFNAGFWPPGVGSQTRVPIFIVGFVRSGSTLLERVLDSHPMIVGTGENSVFNGRLPDIRNQIVQASVSSPDSLGELTRRLAEEVVDEMKVRWEILESNLGSDAEHCEEPPKRFVDKMLTNYYNIGFIQMLYPNALILHVVREPMDTIFSAYKHEFPSGTLDYTSDFEGLVELYKSYRDIMAHWDKALPGRVTHVRYEDMVHDMPGMARAIIEATGLPWDESVLEFHKKKHAVNTLSTTQVRKGVYKDSLKSWIRYEEPLKPLVELVGDLVNYDLKTSLPGYKAPEVSGSAPSIQS